MKKQIKKLIMLLLVFLLCSNNFASVLNGHDGKAFITKGEFDSMKAMFDTDISNYFMSIDNKIEGAIAEYLAGIQLASLKNESILYFKQCIAPAVYCRNYTDMKYNYADSNFEYNVYYGANLIDSGKPYSKVGRAKYYYLGQAGASRMYVKSFLDATGNKKYYYNGYVKDIDIKRVVFWIYIVKNGWGGSHYFPNTDPWYLETPLFNIGNYKEVKPTDNYTIICAFTPGRGDSVFSLLTPAYSNLVSYYTYDKINQNDVLFNVNATEEDDIYFFDEDMQGLAYTQSSITNRLEKDWWPNFNVDGKVTKVTNSIHPGHCAVRVGNCVDAASDYVIEDAPTDVRYWGDLYNSDMTKYKYEDDSGVTQEISTYPLNAGIPIAIMKEGETFEWDISFEDAGNHNIYFFWGPNAGSLDETNTIPVNVNGGTTATWQPEIGGRGKVSFKADRNGIVFAKWRSTDATISAGINLNKSYNCTIYDKE